MPSDLAPYPTPEARERELEALALRAGGEIVVYGESRQGRPLRAVRVPSTTTGTTDTVLASANIHGLELIAGRVALGLLEALAEPTGRLTELKRRAEVWIAPCLNPDGYAKTYASGGVGPVRAMRTNAEGVDLNRNFPVPPGGNKSILPVAGSGRKGSTFYRGEGPLSEPETRALEGLFQRARFRASVNLHSFMGTLITPRVTDRAEYARYGELCRAFASGQKWRYPRFASRTFDAFTGEQEDHQHHAHKTWAVCVETFSIKASFRQHSIAPSTFWRFNPRDPRPWVENDVPGMIEYFLAVLSDTGRG